MSVSTGRPVAEDLAGSSPRRWRWRRSGSSSASRSACRWGSIAANRQGSWVDQAIRVVGLLGYSVPAFWLGLVGLAVFYARLAWVAGPGRIDIFYDGLVPPVTGLLTVDSLIAGGRAIFGNAVSHLILPAAILGFFSLAYIARMTRSFMLDQLGQEYITTARVKGVPERRVLWVHAFRPIRVPLITVIGLSYAGLLEGSVMIETVFSWPGIGNYLTTALFNADMNAVLGATLVIGAVFIFINKIPTCSTASSTRGAARWARATGCSTPGRRPRSRRAPGAAWRMASALMRNPLAVAGAVIVIGLVLTAAFAPWIAPRCQVGQNLGARLFRRAPSTGWAPTSSGATSSPAWSGARGSRS